MDTILEFTDLNSFFFYDVLKHIVAADIISAMMLVLLVGYYSLDKHPKIQSNYYDVINTFLLISTLRNCITHFNTSNMLCEAITDNYRIL